MGVSYDDHDPGVWCDILNFEVDRKVYFNNIYDCMLTKNESDLIWKIGYGAIAIGGFLYGCRYSDSPNCNNCDELDDLTHFFVTCSKVDLVNSKLIRKWTPTIDKIPVWRYIIGIPASAGLDVNGKHLDTGFLRRQKLQLYKVYSTKTGVVGLFV